MKTTLKKTIALIFVTNLLGTNARLMANPWKGFAPQTTAFFKKTVDVVIQKGAIALTLTTPFASPFVLGGYCGKKKAIAPMLNKTERATLSIFDLKYGAQIGLQNTTIALSPLKTSFKAALSCITLSVPTASYALGYRLGTMAIKKKNSINTLQAEQELINPE